MELTRFLTIVVFILAGRLSAQDLHTQANAASVNNEANRVAGWTGTAVISSDANNAYHGDYAIKAVSTSNDGRLIKYDFIAVIGQEYTIKIWAKEGEQVSNSISPAFAAWAGLAGFQTTSIEGTSWNEYVFNVTATSTSCTIRIYTSPSETRFTAGNTVYLDRVSIMPADAESPSAVTSLAASGTTTNTTELSWTASTDNVGVVSYEVYQGSVVIGTPTEPSFSVTGLASGTSYSFTVLALDLAGNVSSAGNIVNITTSSDLDIESPSAVTTLAASGTTTNTTELSWTASTDNVGVSYYQVYQDGVVIGNTNTPSFSVTDLSLNTSYSFTVLAMDHAENVSLAGNIIEVQTLNLEAIPYTTHNANLSTVDWQAKSLFISHSVGIGTTDTMDYKLAIAGKVVAEGVKVALQGHWPDYVFLEDYRLPSLDEVERHIAEKGYLIDVPSASEIEAKGIDLGEMDALLLRKIEELTLYTIQQEKKIFELESINRNLKLLADKILLLERKMEESGSKIK